MTPESKPIIPLRKPECEKKHITRDNKDQLAHRDRLRKINEYKRKNKQKYGR